MQENQNEDAFLDTKLYTKMQDVRNVLEAIPIAILIVKLSDNRIVYVNPKCCEIFRAALEEIIGEVSPNYWESQSERNEYVGRFLDKGFVKDLEVKMKRRDGEVFTALISSTIMEYNGENVNLSGILDIQERKNLETKVSESENRFRTIVETSPNPIVITRASDNIVLYISPSAELVGGLTNKQVVGKPADSFYVTLDDRRRLVASILEKGIAHNFETMLAGADGRVFNVLISASQTVYDNEKAYIFSFQDITHMKMMERELRKLATIDPLTNIANRRAWFERAELEFLRFERYGQPCSLLILDMDHFKKVNDRYGHQVGDEILVDFAARSQQCIRDIDFLGRFGGEEFALLLPGTEIGQAEKVAVKIKEILRSPCNTKQGMKIYYTVSIGIAQFRNQDITFDQVLSRADEALYAAKAAGRNRFAVR